MSLLKRFSAKASKARNIEEKYKKRPNKTDRDHLFRAGRELGFPKFKETFPEGYTNSFCDSDMQAA